MARRSPGAFGCRIHLVRATGPGHVDLRWDTPPESAPGNAETLSPEDAIAQEAEGMRKSGLEVATTVREGVPADVIVGATELGPTPLIAMTTHGRSGVGRWLLGSVADKVLPVSAAPLLLVRPTTEITITHAPFIARVLVPLDESELAELALPHATAIAEKLRVLTMLVQITTEMLLSDDQTTPVEPEPETKGAAQTYLDELAAVMRAEGAGEVTGRAIVGWDAAEHILSAAASPDTLIVMTSRGRSGVKRWALGSVTDRVVRHGAAPVLVVRAGRD
jgi:nucleotide-binding universal stress UspA family protein